MTTGEHNPEQGFSFFRREIGISQERVSLMRDVLESSGVFATIDIEKILRPAYQGVRSLILAPTEMRRLYQGLPSTVQEQGVGGLIAHIHSALRDRPESTAVPTFPVKVRTDENNSVKRSLTVGSCSRITYEERHTAQRAIAEYYGRDFPGNDIWMPDDSVLGVQVSRSNTNRQAAIVMCLESVLKERGDEFLSPELDLYRIQDDITRR